MKQRLSDKYADLLDCVNDYITHMQLINADRVEAAQREVSFVLSEMQMFNLLQKNILRHEGHNALPKT